MQYGAIGIFASYKSSATKPAQPKPTARNTQAWRAIEDMKESRRLNQNLKEVYDDGAEEE
jgi:hypothetical protein